MLEIINILLLPVSCAISILFDFLIFNRISQSTLTNKDKTFESILFFIIFILTLITNDISRNIGCTFIEVILILLYFTVFKKVNIKLVFGSILIFAVFDTALYLICGILMDIIPYGNRYFDSIISITVEIVGYLIIRRYFSQLHKLLTDKNSNIFIGILLYLYIIGIGVEFFISGDNKTTEVVTISLGLLLLQSIFAFVLYYAMIKTENNLLSKKEQENQKLQNQLLKAKNNELSQEKQRQKLQYELLKNEKDKLTEEHNQLKEYAEYLDKNEDDLRKFKHDYQNMMNSLIISAENGKTDEVVSKLKEYTNSHIDSKALRKYKDLNHVHVDFLKSIAIAKLAKLYNANLNYAFGCNKEINRIPKTIDYLDITRIIGIAFDNAYEESMALRKETGNLDSAQILATYYQEDGDFEFEIRNKIRPKKINTKLISRKNYTTKEHHMGIGLANVTEITKKYESTVLVNYGIDDDWFTFSLIVLPDEEE